MVIESIELRNYRSYKELHMELNQGTSILYEGNTQGKTSILEAVYVCCTSKSHKGAKNKDIIRLNRDESHIKLQIRKDNVPYHIDIYLKKNKSKSTTINEVPIRKANELFGIVDMVLFSLEDLNIIKNGPSKRRRFIDMELCQLDKLYVHSLVRYSKVLLQCNKLLKELFFRPECEETLDVWDMQLANHGHEVIKFRRDSIRQLNEIIRAIHLNLTGGREDITTPYEPYTLQDQMENVLKRDRIQDIKQRIVLSRPHRDDISFIINGIDIRRFGSQGQQRTAALSLKLSELELARQLSHNSPILLLDDVLSEPDSSRQDRLLPAIKHMQTIITCTGLDDFINNRFQIDRVFKMVDEAVINEN